MGGSIFTSTILRRCSIGFCASALVAVSLGSGGAASALPARAPTLDTRQAWDGVSGVSSFGRPDTSTYGQVITIPAGKTRLTRFNFYMSDTGYSGSLIMRGEVYAWDGSKAVGSALWESNPRPVDYGDSGYHRKQFRPKGVDGLQPGGQYVIFASVSKDWEQCTDGYPLTWASVPDSTYPDGTFVFINDTGDESQWTTTAWTTTWGIDLAFKAWLS